jgi:glycerophosphoryl diester phosphodiesterase
MIWKLIPWLIIIALTVFLLATCCKGKRTPQAKCGTPSSKIIIAHRGASGYLPEHTLPAKALAHGMGAHYLEQDLVMTQDNHLVVLHDRYLDRVSNVAQVFPDRKREDGRYYVIDFTLAEVRSLTISEGFTVDSSGSPTAPYPNRFPIQKSHFHIHTFQEEIEFIQGLNHSTGKQVGIYAEIKSPWFHHSEGKDIALAALTILKQYGYTSANSNVYLQTFDFLELVRIHDELLPQLGLQIPLVQLIADNSWNETYACNTNSQQPLEGSNRSCSNMQPYDYSWMHTPQGVKLLSQYAQGIGPWYPMVIKDESTKDHLQITPLTQLAHQAGMVVHPYTFRKEANKLPPWATSFEHMLRAFLCQANVDGVFTDFPDIAVHVDSTKFY